MSSKLVVDCDSVKGTTETVGIEAIIYQITKYREFGCG